MIGTGGEGLRVAQPILRFAGPWLSNRPMTSYRRNFVNGGTYFFTVNLADRRRSLLTENIECLRTAFRYARIRHPFAIEAIAVLPDHLRTVWTLPEGDSDFAVRWNLIKGSFSRGLPRGEPVSNSRLQRGERGIWQRRYWEHTIRDEDDFARHVDYIHFNPVKHGYVEGPAAWPYSSFHRMVRLGFYPAEWANDPAESERGFGERRLPLP
jgi:putative transposase